VFKRTSWLLAGVVVSCALVPPALAQEKKKESPIQKALDEYSQFFTPPKTAIEYWAAMKYEVGVGKYDLANTFLKGFIDQKPTDQELLQIEQEEGMAAFLQLAVIPEMRKNARPLIERVTAVVRKFVSDPVRIQKYVRNLSASREERQYAIDQLRIAGPYAVPYLVQALRTTDDSNIQARILGTMRAMKGDMAPPVLAILNVDPLATEARDVPRLRVAMISLLRDRMDSRVVPYLWYLSASPRQLDVVRETARDALVYFLNRPADRLPPATTALTREANRYYEHKADLSPEPSTVWEWTGRDFVMPPAQATPSQAEEYYGIRFAKQALDLDPRDAAAQVVFLSLAVDKAVARAGLDQPLDKAPAVKELLKVVNPELTMAVLDRALNEHRLPVILGAVRALGDLAEVRAIHSQGQQTPVLVRALDYPDRRVQMAAADAIMNIPATPAGDTPARVVDVLRRALGTDSQARAIVADRKSDRGSAVAHSLRQVGYEVELARTGRQVMSELERASDVDVVVVDQGLPDPELPYLLGQLRSDIHSGLLPVVVTYGPNELSRERLAGLQHLVDRYRNVWLMEARLNPTALKRTVDERTAQAGGKALSAEERKAHQALAMLWLKRIATGEKAGYDVRPAEPVILESIRSPELGELAIEAAGRLSDSGAQQALADAVLTGVPKLRAAAALELGRHIQRTGMQISPQQRQDLEGLFAMTREPGLRSNLARLLGVFNPSATVTSERLEQFNPPPLGQPAR